MGAPQIGEGTKVTLDLKTLGIIIGGVISLSSMYFVLQSDIALAMKMPKPTIERIEYDLKDELIRTTIMDIDEKVDGNSDKLDKIDDKLFEIINNK